MPMLDNPEICWIVIYFKVLGPLGKSAYRNIRVGIDVPLVDVKLRVHPWSDNMIHSLFIINSSG